MSIPVRSLALADATRAGVGVGRARIADAYVDSEEKPGSGSGQSIYNFRTWAVSSWTQSSFIVDGRTAGTTPSIYFAWDVRESDAYHRSSAASKERPCRT